MASFDLVVEIVETASDDSSALGSLRILELDCLTDEHRIWKGKDAGLLGHQMMIEQRLLKDHEHEHLLDSKICVQVLLKDEPLSEVAEDTEDAEDADDTEDAEDEEEQVV